MNNASARSRSPYIESDVDSIDDASTRAIYNGTRGEKPKVAMQQGKLESYHPFAESYDWCLERELHS